MAMNIRKPVFVRQPLQPPKTRAAPHRGAAQDFESLLQHADPASKKPITFSAHAQARLQERKIHLGTAEMQQLTTAIDKVEQKGSRESLILMQDLAFVVNVKNRNVITALDGSHMRERVFTNIDSTIIVDNTE